MVYTGLFLWPNVPLSDAEMKLFEAALERNRTLVGLWCESMYGILNHLTGRNREEPQDAERWRRQLVRDFAVCLRFGLLRAVRAPQTYQAYLSLEQRTVGLL